MEETGARAYGGTQIMPSACNRGRPRGLALFGFEGKKRIAKLRPMRFLAALEHDEVNYNGDDHEYNVWRAG